MSLSTYNWVAFGTHLVLAIFFTIYFPIVNKTNPQNQQLRNQMAMQDHKVVLTQDARRHVTLGWTSVTTLHTSLTTVQTLLVAFFYITALFHLIYATSSLYPELIQRHNNWLRWIEYSISSTMMLYIIALLCTVKDTNTYILLGACNIVMILLGQFVEEKINAHESPWLALLASFFLLFAEFGIIIREYLRRIKEVQDYITPANTNVTNTGVSNIPYWISFMVFILFIFFSCFGGVALYQCIHPDTEYESIEKTYIILSLLAKTTLGGFLAYGTVYGQQKFS